MQCQTLQVFYAIFRHNSKHVTRVSRNWKSGSLFLILRFQGYSRRSIANGIYRTQMRRRLCEKFMNSSGTELTEFCRTLPDSQFPYLMRNAAKTIAMFVSTYLCEQAFSVMKLIKTQHRARISDNNLRNSLRICVSNNIHPDFKDMIK